MSIPVAIQQAVNEEIQASLIRRFPLHVRDRIWATHRWRGNTVTIFEWQTLFDDPTKAVDIKVAQFRYDAVIDRWFLFCADRNGRWHAYDEMPGSGTFKDLLHEVEGDPTGIFWG